MNFTHKLLDKIDTLIKLSDEFDSGFKIIYDVDYDKLNKDNIELLYSMTKNYIMMRKEHGELLLMMNNFTNQSNIDYEKMQEKIQEKKSNKNISKTNENMDMNKTLYDLSTFNTLLGNINDLITNIDCEYKKIAIKYPNFINKKQMVVILITKETTTPDKYEKMINELENSHPEHKYKIIKCGDKKDDITKCEEELKEYGIKIKSKSLPEIYIVNGTIISEIPILKIEGTEQIKNLITK